MVDTQSRLGSHHVSYRVEGIVAVRERLIDEGCRPFGTDTIVASPGGGLSFFLRPSDSFRPLVRPFEAY